MKLFKQIIPIILLVFTVLSCDISDVADETQMQGSDIKLVINEYLASNDASFYLAETDDFPDWIEIYNYGTAAVNIGGMYISDTKNDYKKSQISKTNPELTTIPAGGFLVIYCDNKSQISPLHVDFALSADGEDITLTEENGLKIIDEITYTAQTTDISEGRNPDGSETWQQFTSPTPNSSNNGSVASYSPEINDISVSPETIIAGDNVIISAIVTDKDGDLTNVVLNYNGNSVSMTLSDSVFSATISSVADATIYTYFITASDEDLHTTTSDTLSFQVGYIKPILFINEFLASNDANYYDSTTGEYPDWIEIYNPNSEPVDLGGMYITDALDNLTLWQIPTTYPDSTTIPANGFIVLFADKIPGAGVLHVNIKLSGDGEQIGLIAPNGISIIDSLSYNIQAPDTSFGRNPDGSENWTTFPTPTLGASNN